MFHKSRPVKLDPRNNDYNGTGDRSE